MPVGTGSINRAARNSKKTTETKSVGKSVITEVVSSEVPPVLKKTESKKTAVKKAPVKKTPEKKATEKTAPELRVYGNETVFVVGNECCHLTEELPIHLL